VDKACSRPGEVEPGQTRLILLPFPLERQAKLGAGGNTVEIYLARSSPLGISIRRYDSFNGRIRLSD